MFKIFTILIFSLNAAAAIQLDCMIHDNHGKMLADIGMFMPATDHDQQIFTYQDLKIEVSIRGPFNEAPEVSAPQLKLSVMDSKLNILSEVVTKASDDFNTALFIPSKNLFLHCDKMKM